MTELKFVRLAKRAKTHRWAMALEMTRDYGTRQRGVTNEICRATGESPDTLANYHYAGLAALTFRKVDNPKFSTLRQTLPISYFYVAGRAIRKEHDPDYVLHILEEGQQHDLRWVAAQLYVEGDKPTPAATKARRYLLGLLSLVDSMGIPPDLAEEIRALSKKLKGYVK